MLSFCVYDLLYQVLASCYLLQAAALPRGARVEIEAVAVVGEIHTVQ